MSFTFGDKCKGLPGGFSEFLGVSRGLLSLGSRRLLGSVKGRLPASPSRSALRTSGLASHRPSSVSWEMGINTLPHTSHSSFGEAAARPPPVSARTCLPFQA